MRHQPQSRRTLRLEQERAQFEEELKVTVERAVAAARLAGSADAERAAYELRDAVRLVLAQAVEAPPADPRRRKRWAEQFARRKARAARARAALEGLAPQIDRASAGLTGPVCNGG